MDSHLSLNLKDRVLWFDGDSSMSPLRMADRLLAGESLDGIFPIEVDDSIKKFNLYTGNNLALKTTACIPPPRYVIPAKFLELDVEQFLLRKLKLIVERGEITAKDDIDIRVARVHAELRLFEKYKIMDIVRAVIYIVDTFERASIVWGTGRGSSCACYSFYLIGLHDVDSVLYNLDLNEFFKQG